MKIKVCLDISQVAHLGGVGTYTAHLAEELAKMPNIELTPLYYSLRKPYRGNLRHIKSIPLPPTLAEFLFNTLRVPSIENLVGEVDIFHSSDWTQPKTKALKVTTYHDIIPIKYPEWSNLKVVGIHKKRLQIVEREIDMVIAVSEATKQDLLEYTTLTEERVAVVYEAAGEEFQQIALAKIAEFKKRYNLPQHFLLAIGGIGKRRNLENIKKAAGDYQLLITGQTLPLFSAEEMPLLYNAADALVYASLYEGFGLPIIEAMQCGLPVVTSDRSAMKEISGDAAVLVNPEEVESIKKGIKKALDNKTFYRQKGLIWAKNFSWKKCAEQTMAVYKSLYEKK